MRDSDGQVIQKIRDIDSNELLELVYNKEGEPSKVRVIHKSQLDIQIEQKS